MQIDLPISRPLLFQCLLNSHINKLMALALSWQQNGKPSFLLDPEQNYSFTGASASNIANLFRVPCFLSGLTGSSWERQCHFIDEDTKAQREIGIPRDAQQVYQSGGTWTHAFWVPVFGSCHHNRLTHSLQRKQTTHAPKHKHLSLPLSTQMNRWRDSMTRTTLKRQKLKTTRHFKGGYQA